MICIKDTIYCKNGPTEPNLTKKRNGVLFCVKQSNCSILLVFDSIKFIGPRGLLAGGPGRGVYPHGEVAGSEGPVFCDISVVCIYIPL